jgi:hypothetical protein
MNDKIRYALRVPCCSQAMENIFKGGWVSNIPGYILTSRDFGRIIQNGFDWSYSPQGHEYWSEIRNDCYD